MPHTGAISAPRSRVDRLGDEREIPEEQDPQAVLAVGDLALARDHEGVVFRVGGAAAGAGAAAQAGDGISGPGAEPLVLVPDRLRELGDQEHELGARLVRLVAGGAGQATFEGLDLEEDVYQVVHPVPGPRIPAA